MYIDGIAVREMREMIDMSLEQLAEYLAMEVSELESYEEGELWIEEDLFRLLTLSTVMPDSSYLLDGEYAGMFAEIDEEYGL